MNDKTTKIEISISSFSGVYTPNEGSFKADYSLGTCLLKIPELERDVGFEYDAQLSSVNAEGYKALGNHEPKQLERAALDELVKGLSSEKSLNIFNTYRVYISNPSDAYGTDLNGSDMVEIEVVDSFVESIKQQSAEYFEGRENYAKAAERVLEIVGSGMAGHYAAEARAIIRYLHACQESRGWSGLSNSTYRRDKLNRASSNLEDLINRKLTTHPGYVHSQSTFRSCLSGFGTGYYGSPESWNSAPPKAP